MFFLHNDRQNLPLKIKSIHHKGKFIYLMLSNDWIIMITLGMTGRLLLKKEREKSFSTRRSLYSCVNIHACFSSI